MICHWILDNLEMILNMSHTYTCTTVDPDLITYILREETSEVGAEEGGGGMGEGRESEVKIFLNGITFIWPVEPHFHATSVFQKWPICSSKELCYQFYSLTSFTALQFKLYNSCVNVLSCSVYLPSVTFGVHLQHGCLAYATTEL